ncbi:hypothetical protein TNCV_4589821 [Trichonephila clavipes]|nr:hypothetical protein TNCV_4589821 [Trichonephila clavipes]
MVEQQFPSHLSQMLMPNIIDSGVILINWAIDKWMKVIWCDELSFTLIFTTGWVRIWRTPTQEYDLDCLLPTVKPGGGTVMIWEEES